MKRLMWLIIDESKGKLLAPYTERYRIFSDKIRAQADFDGRAGRDTLFGGAFTRLSDTPGVCTLMSAGDVKISAFCLEVEE